TTPTITASSTTTFCAGGSVVLSTAAGANSYQWNLNGTAISGATSNTYTASTAGNYAVTVSNASGCTATSSATTVTVNALPTTPTITAGSATTFCAGGSVILSSATVANSYQWNLNGTAISGATSNTYTASAAGDYT